MKRVKCIDNSSKLSNPAGSLVAGKEYNVVDEQGKYIQISTQWGPHWFLKSRFEPVEEYPLTVRCIDSKGAALVVGATYKARPSLAFNSALFYDVEGVGNGWYKSRFIVEQPLTTEQKPPTISPMPEQVKCIQVGRTATLPDVSAYLTLGKVYDVVGERAGFITVRADNGIDESFFKDRFVLVQNSNKPTMKLNLARNLRARAVPATPAPLNLVNGRIYKVKFEDGSGEIVAKLRQKVPAISKVDGDWFVLTAHSKPVLAERKEIGIANATEVQAYLGESK